MSVQVHRAVPKAQYSRRKRNASATARSSVHCGQRQRFKESAPAPRNGRDDDLRQPRQDDIADRGGDHHGWSRLPVEVDEKTRALNCLPRIIETEGNTGDEGYVKHD
jgi:hypothetical protein